MTRYVAMLRAVDASISARPSRTGAKRGGVFAERSRANEARFRFSQSGNLVPATSLSEARYIAERSRYRQMRHEKRGS